MIRPIASGLVARIIVYYVLWPLLVLLLGAMGLDPDWFWTLVLGPNWKEIVPTLLTQDNARWAAVIAAILLGFGLAIFLALSGHKPSSAPSIENGLVARDAVVYYDLVQGSSPPKIQYIQLGIELENITANPIHYELQEIESSIVENGEIEKGDWSKYAIVNAHSRVRCVDYRIDVGGIPCGKVWGDIKMNIRYGSKGDLRFKLPLKARFEMFFDPQTGIYQGTRIHWDYKYQSV